MSDLPWLRLYTDTIDNEKIRLLAFEDRWHYIALLCIKQQGILDGHDDLLERKLAIKLGLNLVDLGEVKKRLMDVDLIGNDWNPKGWENKQFKSDSSTSRVRKYRENKKKKTSNGDETLPKRKSNAIDTDTDTDTEKKKTTKKASKVPTVEEIKTYCQERGNNIDAEQFFNHYEANGWFRGKTKIKNWKSCVITWEKNNNGKGNQKQTGRKTFDDYNDDLNQGDKP